MSRSKYLRQHHAMQVELWDMIAEQRVQEDIDNHLREMRMFELCANEQQVLRQYAREGMRINEPQENINIFTDAFAYMEIPLHSQGKKDNSDSPNENYLGARSKIEGDNKLGQMSMDADNHSDTYSSQPRLAKQDKNVDLSGNIPYCCENLTEEEWRR